MRKTKLIDLTGKKFNKFTVIKRVYPENRKYGPYWLCKCDCGKERIVTGGPLRYGHHSSCGCSRKNINRGELNGQWKGEGVGYSALHNWVKRRLQKPKSCEFCSLDKPLDLANKSNQYLRDVNDWLWLCTKCHRNYDLRENKLKQGRFVIIAKRYKTTITDNFARLA